MADNLSKPIAPSGFRGARAVIEGRGGTGYDRMEYNIPEAGRVDSGFYVGDRGLPWHVVLSRRLNTPELMADAGRLLNAKEAQTLAGLDFTVEKWPLLAYGPESGTADVTKPTRKYATVRTDTGAALGVVGDVYRVLQNSDAFAFMDDLVDDGGCHFETAGVMNGGARVFISMEVPAHIVVEGDESPYRLFLVVANGHDGGQAVQAMVTTERVVCRNTLRAAMRSAQRTWQVRHTTNLDGRLSEARAALGLSFRYAEVFAETASAMVSTTLAERQVNAILAEAFPLPEPKEGEKELSEAVLARTDFARVQQVYHESPTVQRGTAWGVMNAVTEYYDHGQEYRGRTGASDDEVRLRSLLFDDGTSNAKKQKAWDLLVQASEPALKARMK